MRLSGDVRPLVTLSPKLEAKKAVRRTWDFELPFERHHQTCAIVPKDKSGMWATIQTKEEVILPSNVPNSTETQAVADFVKFSSLRHQPLTKLHLKKNYKSFLQRQANQCSKGKEMFGDWKVIR